MQNVKKKNRDLCLRSCCSCKIGVKWWPICPNQQQLPLLEISYISPLSVMTLHYHILYQISSLEANLGIPTPKLIIINPDFFLH